MEKHQVFITCLNNRTKRAFKAGTSLIQIYEDLQVEMSNVPLVAMVNNEVRELGFKVYKPKIVEFLGVDHPAGHRAYVHSLAFLLHAAIRDIFPMASLRIEHSVSNGYYCKINGTPNKLNGDDVDKIYHKMKALVELDIPFVRHTEETENVMHVFTKQHLNDKVKLLETGGQVFSDYYTLDKVVDNFYGNLILSSGYLTNFGLVKFDGGILLQVPRKDDPTKLEPILSQPKMMDIFKEYSNWNKVLTVENIGDLNKAHEAGQAFDLIKVAEAFHEKKVASIADMIAARQGDVKVILVSGPSSSGKTTFSKRLSLQLKVAGIKPIALSMDDYFVNREDTPKDENGELDFESLYAIDLELFNQHVNALLNGEQVELPEFSFATGTRKGSGKMIKLEAHQVLIVEGIHALNPILTQGIDDKKKFRIYVSALTTISIDEHNWIPTSDNRLLRRIVRDYRYRGYSAQDTISRWPSVRKGENKWIYPYQENCDVMFNSALLFELAVLKRYAEPILYEVRQNCKEYAEARRLLNFLKLFSVIWDNEIPPTSLLREFLGGSSFSY